MKVSQFSSTFARTSAAPVEITAILSDIKNGRWEKQITALRNSTGKTYDEKKRKLPAFTVSGIFSRRSDEGFVSHSGLVQVDVDGKDNRERKYKDLWQTVISCPYVYAAFRSPSGKGIKALVRCPADKDQHAGSYKAAAKWLEDRGVTVDTQVCALSQLCFISHDPELFVNKKARQVSPLPVEKTECALTEYEELRSRDEILKACEEQHPELFPDLWEGNYEHITDDASKADFQLISILRDNCQSNEMVAELFTESGLYRGEAKWGGRTRDYVFYTLRKTKTIQALSLLTPIPEDPEDPSPPRKKKHRGWSWETVADVPEWKSEDENYIVKKLLYENSLSCIYGAPGSGKTFAVFSLAACVASGRPWRDHKVKRGGVLYFGLEGRHGIHKRIQAMKRDKLMTDEDPFAIVECKRDSLNLLSEDHVQKVVETVSAYEAECGHQVKMVIVDTLARATPGGDENSTKDMGTALINCQGIIDQTGCGVILLHHSGKDAGKGMRGSSALLGGLDSVIEIQKHDDDPTIRVFKIRKQRDEADVEEIFFRLIPTTLGLDADLDPVTTCLVHFLEPKDIPEKKDKARTDADSVFQLIPVSGITFSELMKLSGVSRGTLQRRLNLLVDDGSIRKTDDGFFRIEEDTDDML